jgi:hypothetical protein
MRAMRRPLLSLLCLPLLAAAHEGCYAPTPQLAILRIAQNAQLARLAKIDEERYWEAARAVADAQTLRDARQRSSEEGARRCEALVAPHAGAPLEAAFQWQCEAEWSRRAAHRVWREFLRGRTTEPPEPPEPARTEGVEGTTPSR